MESRDQRIMTLATTLKSSGIAKTDSQARMMAEEMIGVEEHVQKDYEAEHEKAHEYLQTAKNLRVPRPASASEIETMNAQNKKESSFSKSIEPLPTKSQTYKTAPIAESNQNEEDNEDIKILTFGTKKSDNINSTHNTHNSALEAIKSQIQNGDMMPIRDDEESVSEQSNNDIEDEKGVDITSIEPDSAEETSNIITKIDDTTTETSTNNPDSGEEIPADTTTSNENSSKGNLDNKDPTVKESDNVVDDSKEVVIDERLDSKKLVELMEEDGKMEEHTREIKEPPKDVKPKEEYVENSIDLSNVFNFNKK